MELSDFDKRYPSRHGLPVGAEVSRVAPSPTGRPHIGTALQGVIPEIIESVIRAKTVTEMFTIWPEQKDEIVKNLMFRWTGQVTGDETDGDGAADS